MDYEREYYCNVCRDSGWELIDYTDSEFQMQLSTKEIERIHLMYGEGNKAFERIHPYTITCRKCNGESKRKRDVEFLKKKEGESRRGK